MTVRYANRPASSVRCRCRRTRLKCHCGYCEGLLGNPGRHRDVPASIIDRRRHPHLSQLGIAARHWSPAVGQHAGRAAPVRRRSDGAGACVVRDATCLPTDGSRPLPQQPCETDVRWRQRSSHQILAAVSRRLQRQYHRSASYCLLTLTFLWRWRLPMSHRGAMQSDGGTWPTKLGWVAHSAFHLKLVHIFGLLWLKTRS